MEVEKLARFNEWWRTGGVAEGLLGGRKRPLFSELKKYIELRQIILVTGLRRVGKTTLMYQLIQYLLDSGVDKHDVLYYSFDDKTIEPDDLIKTYEQAVLKSEINRSKKYYLFLDEVQKLNDWQNKIKIYYDLYPKMKFVISGSAAVQLNKKAKESLAGRIFDFVLEPLSFKEFIEWKGIKVERNLELYSIKLAPLFNDYLRKGGFPEIINETDESTIKAYIKNSILEKVIYKDIPEEFGIRDYALLKIIIELIAREPGFILNYDAVSKDLNRSKQTIMDYFFYLEYSMLIRLVSNYRKGFRIASRKLKKVYTTNTAISFAFVDEFYSKEFMEKIAENFAVVICDAKNYYKNKFETDIVLKRQKEIIPIEIKYGRPETKSIAEFLQEFKIEKGFILTKDIFKSEGKIKLIPLWAFALNKENFLS